VALKVLPARETIKEKLLQQVCCQLEVINIKHSWKYWQNLELRDLQDEVSESEMTDFTVPFKLTVSVSYPETKHICVLSEIRHATLLKFLYVQIRYESPAVSYSFVASFYLSPDFPFAVSLHNGSLYDP
jgi:hypothetical protein